MNKKNKAPKTRKNSFSVDMIVYAATLSANYAYYVQVWKDGKRAFTVTSDIYAARAYVHSYGFNTESFISDFMLSLRTEHDKKHKLAGMFSVNTYCGMNSRCKARRENPALICAKCYAFNLTAIYDTLQRKLIKATFLYCNELINECDMPVINAAYERIESFGELNNVIQARNYLRYVKHNPRTTFTQWTKNADILAAAIDIEGKPKNLILVFSSYRLNIPDTWIFEKFKYNGKPLFDKLFTVYTAEYAIMNNIAIHCIDSKCMKCMRCYSRRGGKIVNEIVKIQQPYYKELLAAKAAGESALYAVFRNKDKAYIKRGGKLIPKE